MNLEFLNVLDGMKMQVSEYQRKNKKFEEELHGLYQDIKSWLGQYAKENFINIYENDLPYAETKFTELEIELTGIHKVKIWPQLNNLDKYEVNIDFVKDFSWLGLVGESEEKTTKLIHSDGDGWVIVKSVSFGEKDILTEESFIKLIQINFN